MLIIFLLIENLFVQELLDVSLHANLFFYYFFYFLFCSDCADSF